MQNKKMLGNILLILTAMIWGTAFVFQRVGMESIEPVTFNAVRMALAAAAVGISVDAAPKKAARAGGAEAAAVRRANIIGGLCCGAFLAGGSIFQQMGIVYTSAGKAGFITAMYILIVPVINFAVFKKKNTLLVWLAVAMGVAGMYLLCLSGVSRLTRGDMLVCVSAFMFSGHILCCDHFASAGNPVRVAAMQFAVCAAISGVIALMTEAPTTAKIASAAVPILYCGLVSGGIGYTLQLVAQRFSEPTTASLLMSLEAVFAVIAGSLILKERMSSRELLGCIVIFAATVLVQIPHKRPEVNDEDIRT